MTTADDAANAQGMNRLPLDTRGALSVWFEKGGASESDAASAATLDTIGIPPDYLIFFVNIPTYKMEA